MYNRRVHGCVTVVCILWQPFFFSCLGLDVSAKTRAEEEKRGETHSHHWARSIDDVNRAYDRSCPLILFPRERERENENKRAHLGLDRCLRYDPVALFRVPLLAEFGNRNRKPTLFSFSFSFSTKSFGGLCFRSKRMPSTSAMEWKKVGSKVGLSSSSALRV